MTCRRFHHEHTILNITIWQQTRIHRHKHTYDASVCISTFTSVTFCYSKITDYYRVCKKYDQVIFLKIENGPPYLLAQVKMTDGMSSSVCILAYKDSFATEKF